MSSIKQLFASLLMHAISGRLSSITLSVLIGKSHKILHPSFSSTESGTCSYRLSLNSRWNFLHSSQWIFFATLSCLFLYWFFSRLGQALMMCVTLSTFLLQSPQRRSFTGLVNAILHWISSNSLLLCSTKETFSLPFQLSFPRHSHFLLSLWHSISLTNCPCSAFCFHSFNRFSFFSFLFILTMYFSKLSSAAAVLTRASLLCSAYFARLHLSSSSQFSTLSRPLPPLLLGM